MSKLNPWLLDLLNRLAEGVVAVVGPHCEVVVHDFADAGHSVVGVAGNVTGCKPGAPVPDLSFTPEELTHHTCDQFNYSAQRGSRQIQSSTIWIRDPENRPIGAICINVDYTDLMEAHTLLEKLAAPTRATSDLVVTDTFARDVDELIELATANFLRKEGLPSVDAMSYEDKVHLIQQVEARGLFQIRGAVNRLADLLNVSRASIYNYRAMKR